MALCHKWLDSLTVAGVYDHDSTALVEVDPIIVEASRSHSDTSRSVALLWVIGPSQRHLPHNTQLSQQADVHISGGIRTHNLSKWADADSFLRPRGRWARRKFFSPVPPHVLCGLRGPPSSAWQDCNRLLRLGRPWGAVTLSQWCVSGDRGGCSARRGLKPKFYYSTQTMITAGIFPFKQNSDGRAWNRTRDLMISSRRLWPLDHEASHRRKFIEISK